MLLFHYTKLIIRDKGFKKARIFFLRSLLHYKRVANWLAFIDSFYKKYNICSVPNNLAGLAIRSYASNNFCSATKVNVMKDHYLLMEQFFSIEAIHKFLSKDVQDIIISSIQKKNGDPCFLKLLIHGKFWREGAMTIYLSDSVNQFITTLTFTFCYDFEGKKTIFIGGLQGGSDVEKSNIVQLTRNLGGLRPKHTLIECCYVLANHLGFEKIVGISNKNHVLSYQGSFQKSYNNIWEEIGATLLSDGNYLLPKSLIKRDFESVPQKKRKDWLIRHGHLEKLSSEIVSFLKESAIDRTFT